MPIPRWLTKSDSESEACFGVLFGDANTFPEMLKVNVLDRVDFAQCYGNVTTISVLSGHGLFDEFATQADLSRAVIYRPHARVCKAALEDLYVAQLRTSEAISELRRKVEGFSSLPANWDGEGAEQISPQTVKTALQIIERIAIVLERKNTLSAPSVRAFPDGSIFFKWIRGQKELAITVQDRNIEAQHWEPLDAFDSEGLWEIPIDATSEHVEWVLT